MEFTMNSLFSILLVSCMIVTCYSAVFLERQLVIPGHEDECYDKEHDVFYKKGELMKWSMKFCGRKICRGSDGKERAYAETHTCGKIVVPPECHIEADLQLPYPNCCGKLICPEVLNLKNNTI